MFDYQERTRARYWCCGRVQNRSTLEGPGDEGQPAMIHPPCDSCKPDLRSGYSVRSTGAVLASAFDQ